MILHVMNKTFTTDLDVSIFYSTDSINPKEWNHVVRDKNIYATLPYLTAMEKSLGTDMDFRYLVFYNESNSPVAVAVIQCLSFLDKGFEDIKEFCRIRNSIKKRLFATNGIRMMTCGTPFASGENGFIFSDAISPIVAYENLAKSLIHLQKSETTKAQPPVILFKEIFPSSFSASKSLIESKFSDFFVDVNMIMRISPKWKSMDDYLDSMVTKFRTKAKTALRKSEPLFVQDFSLEDIATYKEEILSLYLQVLAKSSFQFGILNAESFLHLKKNLGDKFILKGYFLEMKLIGFSSSFIFNSVLDANYVGINYEFNNEYALYQRMLYDYIELAIQRNCSELRFGRTAEEIKSSVGANPVPMKLFIRHRNPIANRILKAIVGTIKPSEHELRKPFKLEFTKAES